MSKLCGSPSLLTVKRRSLLDCQCSEMALGEVEVQQDELKLYQIIHDRRLLHRSLFLAQRRHLELGHLPCRNPSQSHHD